MAGYITGNNAYGFQIPTGKLGTLVGGVEGQVAAALAGQWLSNHGQVGAAVLAQYAGAPENLEGGYVRSAFWQAVAARVLRSRTLALTAQKNLAYGVSMAAMPGTTTDPATISKVMTDAANTIQGYATSASDAGQRANGIAAAAQLRAIGSVAAIQHRQNEGNGWGWYIAGGLLLAGGAFYFWKGR
jgi:hypothetical protein